VENEFVEGARRLANRAENFIMSIPTPQRKQDTSWHDDMVRKANEGFRVAAERDRAASRKKATKRNTAPAKRKASGR